MIEVHFDQRELERLVSRLGNMPRTLSTAIPRVLKATVPEVRRTVISTLESEVAVERRVIRRAVKAIRYSTIQAQFRIVSKNLFLDAYPLTPREQTARAGISSRRWPGFSYQLCRGGNTYSSFSTSTGRDGTGSKPFLGRTQKGNLRVLYRRGTRRDTPGKDVFLAYAPSVQYHAAAPEVTDTTRVTALRLFQTHLNRILHELSDEGGR